MVLRKCEICNYSTSSKFNFEKHLQTKKHLHNMSENSKNEQKNVEKCGKNVEKCGENVEKCGKLWKFWYIFSFFSPLGVF